MVIFFHCLYPCLNYFNGIMPLLLILPLMFFLFRFIRHYLMLSETLRLSNLVVPSNISCEKGVELSLPISVLKGLIVTEIPWAWCRCCVLPDANRWSITSWLWIVFNCTLLWSLMSLRCMVVSIGMSNVFNETVDLLLVIEFILFHILIIFSIFIMLMMVLEDDFLF